LAGASNGRMMVYFSPPASNGSAAISAYTARCTSNGVSKTGSGLTSPLIVSGLTNGATYSCTVQATNAAGSSGESAASRQVLRPPLTIVPIMMLLH
jgi:hypothetical protein